MSEPSVESRPAIAHRGTTAFSSRWIKVAGVVVLTILLTESLWARVQPKSVCPDFICFWSAGSLLASGQSPYDPALQTKVQQLYGWDRATNGIGIYDFLPYFYPPWFGMLFVAFLPFGYGLARLLWLVVNVELVVFSGYLLRNTLGANSRAIPIAIISVFALSVSSLLIGQTPPLVFFLIAVCWSLLKSRRDWWAGSALAWLTIKPQLTVVLLLGLLLWVISQRRWRVLQGFVMTLSLLVLASFCVLPTWPWQMLRATSTTPLPTQYYPWFGTTWLLVLRTLGLHGIALWVLYGAVALPFLVVVIKTALDQRGSLGDVFALALLAAFFIAPYGQPYDFMVLVMPLLVLVGGRLRERESQLLVLVLLLIPYVHLVFANRITLWWVPAWPTHQVTLFWIPLLLAGAWVFSSARSRRTALQPRLS